MQKLLALLMSFLMLASPTFGETETKYAALTFDDGPSGRFTRQLLDGLKAREVKATFFVCGYRIQDYPREFQRILAEGHEVGNHGFSHKNMQSLGRREIAAEIMDTQALMPEGTKVRYLRPPGGCCNDSVKQVAEARGLAIAHWSVDPKDWATDDAAAVENFVAANTHDGDIILMHDMSESSVKAALGAIDRLTKQGFRFVTLSELASRRGITPRPGKSYDCFRPRDD